ncbi:hypothetical protein ACTXT7_014943, partial [Hymenolepis weldensis]
MSTTFNGNDAFHQANQPKLEDLTNTDISSPDVMKMFTFLDITNNTIAKDPLFSAAAKAFYTENNSRVEHSPESNTKMENLEENAENFKKLSASLSLVTASREPDAEQRWGKYLNDLKRSMLYGNAEENVLTPNPDAGLQKLQRIIK